MELDELKDLIKDKPVSYSRNELESIFSIKTKREVDGINKKMLWDMVLMIAMAAVIIGLAFLLGLRDRFSLSVEVVLLVALISIHYRIKHLKISRINLSRYDLTTGIKKVVKTLKLYLKLYTIVVPLLGSVFYGYQRWQFLRIKNNLPADVNNVLMESAILIAVGITIYFITRWVSQKLYGKEVKRMEDYLHKLA